MTTDSASRAYLAEHQRETGSKGVVRYNPCSVPTNELPPIFGYRTGGEHHRVFGELVTAGGVVLGKAICSNEGYLKSDLGILEGVAPWMHEKCREYYPNGYRMVFVESTEIETHEGLRCARAAKETR